MIAFMHHKGPRIVTAPFAAFNTSGRNGSLHTGITQRCALGTESNPALAMQGGIVERPGCLTQ